MTQDQFIHWLKGFLDGKEFSENPSLQKIKEKLEQIKSVSTFPNQYPTYPSTVNPFYVGDVPGWTYPFYSTSTISTNTAKPEDLKQKSGKQLLTENEG